MSTRTDTEQLLPTGSPTVILPPLLCAPASYYAVASARGASAMDWQLRFDKRFKSTHRFSIADTHGRLDLTVPIAKPQSSRCTWGDIELSDHGRWWDIHRVALESAYGRTPYFEFYIDPLLPMLTEGVTERFPRLRDLSEAWDGWIRQKLLIPARSPLPDAGERPVCLNISPDLSVDIPPYRQIRQEQLGFIGGLSVLDLIFNLGPEAVIYIDSLAEKFRTTHG